MKTLLAILKLRGEMKIYYDNFLDLYYFRETRQYGAKEFQLEVALMFAKLFTDYNVQMEYNPFYFWGNYNAVKNNYTVYSYFRLSNRGECKTD